MQRITQILNSLAPGIQPFIVKFDRLQYSRRVRGSGGDSPDERQFYDLAYKHSIARKSANKSPIVAAATVEGGKMGRSTSIWTQHCSKREACRSLTSSAAVKASTLILSLLGDIKAGNPGLQRVHQTPSVQNRGTDQRRRRFKIDAR